MTWIWVEDKDSGHRYDVDARAFDDNAHRRLDLKAYPDLDGSNDRPRQTQYRTDKAGNPAPKAGQPATSKES
jgi:hypothetical protein